VTGWDSVDISALQRAYSRLAKRIPHFSQAVWGVRATITCLVRSFYKLRRMDARKSGYQQSHSDLRFCHRGRAEGRLTCPHDLQRAVCDHAPEAAARFPLRC